MRFVTFILPPLLMISMVSKGNANTDAKLLFEYLLSDYNKLVRPVTSNETLEVKFKLKLSQLLDINEKNQIMTTNVWLEHTWIDEKLTWNPSDYGGVDTLYVPADMIWLPDVVLYNNADGNYQVTIMTKAKVTPNGTVFWKPPAIYKSMCQIDVTWFPFDTQRCELKFGSWTYGGLEVDLKHKDSNVEEIVWAKVHDDSTELEKTWVVKDGIDISDFYTSVEWDIIKVPGVRHRKKYPCCDAPFIDITYTIHLRRKTLFHTINLIFPSVGISFLTALVFYLPSDCGEKISLCISILISLTVFFLLLVEIIPSTSLVIPLIGKYLLFTMVLVTLSVVVTVITLNIHYRSPTTHRMPRWIRVVFIETLPRFLQMRRPIDKRRPRSKLIHEQKKPSNGNCTSAGGTSRNPSPLLSPQLGVKMNSSASSSGYRDFSSYSEPSMEYSKPSECKEAVDNVCFIARHFKNQDDDDKVVRDWKFVAQVLDRLFLWIFTVLCASGTFLIILRAPTLYFDDV